MQSQSVFHDPSGRRGRWLARLGAGLGLVVAVLSTLFVVSVVVMVPLLPQVPGISSPVRHSRKIPLPALPERQTRLAREFLRRSRMALWSEIRKTNAEAAAGPPAPAPLGPRVSAAFYAPWQDTGLESLRSNADKLTHFMPEWLHLTATGDGLDTTDWDPTVTPRNDEATRIAREHRLRICPILNNVTNSGFDWKRAHALLASPEKQTRLALALRDFLVQQHFQGLNLDFEALHDRDYPLLPAFLQRLAAVFKPAGLTINMDVEAELEPAILKRVAASCDFVILMAYDEHDASSKPGPIASIGWYADLVRRVRRTVPPEKLVIGLGGYAYDWTEGKAHGNSITYQDAIVLARDYRDEDKAKDVVDFDEDALNSNFDYEDDDGKTHEVWMLDAVSAYDEWLLAKREGVRGAALWVLGSEDPGIWSFLNYRTLFSPHSPHALAEVSFPYDIDFQGEGELLSVISSPKKGHRTTEVDPETGLITDMEYQRFPSSYVIRRAGYRPKTIAITFDDGPDRTYTPQILDELKRLGVPATFFVLGDNAEHNPDLIRRIYREGHEIGSHTFTHPNLGTVSENRARLELNTTQRAIQSILGHSTILFRPPYNADAEPTTAVEVKPVLLASSMGYLIVGELLDPQDWNTTLVKADGRHLPLTPEYLAHSIMEEVHTTRGNTLLLHDAGGDRTATVAALGMAIPALQKEGYRFVTVSGLQGVTRDVVMPRLSAKELAMVGLDRVVFDGVFGFETLLSLAFITAILLGVGRILFVTPLAVAHWFRNRKQVWDPHFRPSVSVVIAGYNEAPVIARTIRSVLASHYDALEVIVVDDGSTDGTGDEVERAFAADPRVRLIRQENGGKASALNNGIGYAAGEVLVCLDADTQFTPDTLPRLVRHFQNPGVGAVAGNVKVGNRTNLLTRWQAIEYITSQNLDRCAYSQLNAITVVPGAVGAWRRSAVQAAGGFLTDTLAEDMDLTWRLRRQGWRIDTESTALAYTEAPDNLRTFCKQRFRWTYGTLQCLWKHRGALGRHGWFGRLALPGLWMFQMLFQIVAPLVDLQIVYSIWYFTQAWLTRGMLHHEWQPLMQNVRLLQQFGFFYALFFAVEMLGAIVAFLLDREPLSQLWYLFWQRFVYRQLMYLMVWKSLFRALHGVRQGWGKFERKGTVHLPDHHPAETA